MHKKFSVNKFGYSINAHVELMNSDMVVTLTGGDVPHLGGVVTYDFKTKKIEKVYFASHDGRKHKDVFLAESFAQKIISDLSGNLCVTAGIHIDGITKEQIDASFVMCDELGEQVLNWVDQKIKTAKIPKYTTHLKRDKNGKLID
ncbi:prenylated flavin chaperone LpdD [Lactobacillus isalae]|uniref:prenylated flavin chaperone LpdD n=1 Tax=Lactobacillus isalae TaxID=2993455 RepID=UPI0024A86E6A|nr:hypothetical protein [Lactobacillus isalae]